MTYNLRASAVRVPCSTSNLGSGFDTLGLAMDRYLTASFEPGGSELRLEREGTLAELDAREEDAPEVHVHEGCREDIRDDILVSAFVDALGRDGIEPRGVLRMTSEIPIAKGLGSSAAAVLAGCDLARAVRGLPPDPDEALRTAYAREGHGDNAAPIVLGGLVAVAATLDGLRAIPLPLSDGVGFAYAAPAAGVATEAARDALPAQVPHATAAAMLGHLAALLRGLAEADRDLIAIGIEDHLHVPHRLPLIPGAYNAMGAGHEAGAWAITVSGAGSGLLAFCDPGDAEQVAEGMRMMFAGGDPEAKGCVGFALHPDREGMRRV